MIDRKQIARTSAAVRLSALVCICGCASTSVNSRTDASADPPLVLDSGLPDTNAPGCSNTEDPASDPAKCFTDELAVFVSAEAQPGGTGTKLRPFRTIGEAVSSTKSRIVVCEGIYTETVTVGRPIEIFSRVNCAFNGSGARAQLFAPEGQERAMFVSQVRGFKLTDIEVSGPAKGVPNSIGLVLNAVSDVVITRSLLVGGVGAEGASGLPATQSGRGTDGKGADGGAGGGTVTHACPVGTSGSGGRGGDTDNPGTAGGPSGTGGAGGTVAACSPDGFGKTPAAPTAKAPAKGAELSGKLQEVTWQPQAGQDGAVGDHGKGGGGGAGAPVGGGGSGGAGGCGGLGGAAGKGGGASFGLLAAGSDVKLVGSRVRASKAGKGGAGAIGQQGQAGGFAGGGNSDGCSGAAGAAGGAGGAGGGGAGGLSVGVAYSGTKPTWDTETKFEVPSSNAGEKGPGGVAGTNDGILGAAAESLSLP